MYCERTRRVAPALQELLQINSPWVVDYAPPFAERRRWRESGARRA